MDAFLAVVVSYFSIGVLVTLAITIHEARVQNPYSSEALHALWAWPVFVVVIFGYILDDGFRALYNLIKKKS